MSELIKRSAVLSLWLAFALLIYLYFFYFIDPTIIDFNQQNLFLTSPFFFQKYMAFPGGLGNYLSSFLSQYYAYKVIGSIILTCLIVFAAYLANRLTMSSIKSSGLASLLTLFLLVNLLSFYSFNLVAVLVLLSSFGASLAYFKLHKKALFYRIAFVVIVNPVLIYLFGGSAAISFSLIITAKLLTDRKAQYSLLVVFLQWITVVSLLFLFARWSAYLSFWMAIQGVFYNQITQPYFYQLLALFLLVPVFLVLQQIVPRVTYKNKLIGKTVQLGKGVEPILMIALLVFCFYLSYNSFEKDKVEIHKYAEEGNWRRVIELGESLPLNERVVLFEINRALFYQGRLLEDAFKYPQYYGESGLILTPNYSNHVLYLCSDLYHRMAYSKGSLHWAYEAQTKFEDAPRVLKRIAEDNIILGNYPTAEKFLNILSQSVIHQSWAEDRVKYLYNDSLINADKKLKYSRDMMIEMPFYANTKSPYKDLILILNEHPDNKMAFEYLMLSLMMRHDLGTLAKAMSFIKPFSYTKMPTLLEEALMLFQVLDDEKKHNYPFNKETVRRFNHFSSLLSKYKKDKRYKAELTKYYKDTYWYYFQFISPMMNENNSN